MAPSFEPLPDVVSTLQEMFPNLFKTQTLAGETNWRKFALIQEPDCTASHITDQDVSFTIVGTYDENVMFYCYFGLLKWLKRLLHTLRHLFSQNKSMN